MTDSLVTDKRLNMHINIGINGNWEAVFAFLGVREKKNLEKEGEEKTCYKRQTKRRNRESKKDRT